MGNYHSYNWIWSQMTRHYEEAKKIIDPEHIVGLFLQGSQNYGMDTQYSDVDTKLIVTPTLDDLIFNRKPLIYTHILDNNEHIDIKDIRLYLEMFKKQNINMVEILFTPYYLVNNKYSNYWSKLFYSSEKIGRYNIPRAIKAMTGVALEKYHAMEHRYPAKVDIIDKFGYDPKQLHHLLRVEDYLERYIAGAPYEACLKPCDPEYLIQVKLGMYDLDKARTVANLSIEHIDKMCERFTKDSDYNKNNPFVDELLDDIQEQIMTKSIINELK